MVQLRQDDDDDFESLVDGIYSAAADPMLWSSALDKLSDSLGGAAFIFSSFDHGRLTFARTHRLDPCHDRVLMEAYSSPATNPFVAAMHHLPKGRIIPRRQVVDKESYDRSPIYNEVFRPQRLRHAMISCLDRYQNTIMPLGVFLAHGTELQREHVRAMSRVAPHLRRAIHLTVKLEEAEEARRRAEAATDLDLEAVLMLDAAGRIVFANHAAIAELASQEMASGRGGRLVLKSEASQRSLMKLVFEAATGTGARGGSLAVLNATGALVRGITVVPAPSSGRRCDSSREGEALVRMIDLTARRAPGSPRLQDIFGLTAAEARLAADLAHGCSPEEVADRRGVRISTIRSQIRSLLDKTGQGRLVDLARLLERVR